MAFILQAINNTRIALGISLNLESGLEICNLGERVHPVVATLYDKAGMVVGYLTW